MSWLLFLDESGHDHRAMPYEVRGGVALHVREIWPFTQQVRRLELAAFGTALHQFRKELKGGKLLDKDRFRWAAQQARMTNEERRKHCRGFLTKGLENKRPSRDEFTSYGQACLEMARGIFQLLHDHRAKIFAAIIPIDSVDLTTDEATAYLRKDFVFLFERFFYFLEAEQEHGLLVVDEVEKTQDRRFVQRLEDYFTKTQSGRYRTAWIVPAPFFVASDMTYPVQAADLAIYCVNWGFRLPTHGMDAAIREEIADEFGPWLRRLQFQGESDKGGSVYKEFGIVFVPDPYQSRQ